MSIEGLESALVIYVGNLTSISILPKQTKRHKETVEESGVLEKQMKQNTSKAFIHHSLVLIIVRNSFI